MPKSKVEIKSKKSKVEIKQSIKAAYRKLVPLSKCACVIGLTD